MDAMHRAHAQTASRDGQADALQQLLATDQRCAAGAVVGSICRLQLQRAQRAVCARHDAHARVDGQVW